MGPKGLPRWLIGKGSACQRRKCRCGFNPWVRKIPCTRKWQRTPVFLPGKFHGQRSLSTVHGVTKSQTWLSMRAMGPKASLQSWVGLVIARFPGHLPVRFTHQMWGRALEAHSSFSLISAIVQADIGISWGAFKNTHVWVLSLRFWLNWSGV